MDNHQRSAYISAPRVRRTHLAQVAELVDALVSGTSGESRGGSSPLLGTRKRPNAQGRPEIRLRAGGGHRLRLPKRLPGVLKLFACSWMGWPCGDPASSRGRCRLAVSARGLISALNFCRRSHRPISVICEARFVSSLRLAAPFLYP